MFACADLLSKDPLPAELSQTIFSKAVLNPAPSLASNFSMTGFLGYLGV
jgi:hypothetical protein